ncbi:hypothetical protein PHMEG_00032017 [Phytophthora megakarya]|uniref:Uncharacterized protein n=1 Tax=Phytophthora megakarya TaxID=4795 RepID=A0A225UXA1_9STRA|nr:hypothetical protein PHMEG_00032017 [Phytophthora megakarya]
MKDCLELPMRSEKRMTDEKWVHQGYDHELNLLLQVSTSSVAVIMTPNTNLRCLLGLFVEHHDRMVTISGGLKAYIFSKDK